VSWDVVSLGSRFDGLQARCEAAQRLRWRPQTILCLLKQPDKQEATSVDLFRRVAIDAGFDSELASTRMSVALDSFVLSALQTELALVANRARALVYQGFEVVVS